MTEKFKNKFVQDLVDARNGGAGSPHLGFRAGKNGEEVGHGGCYSTFDTTGKDHDNLPFWFPPAFSTAAYNKSLENREFYAFHAITNPDSPWQPWLDAMPEQFEGYDTPEEKAWLIARVGLIFGETAWNKLSLTEVGCFAVFHRVAYEFKGVRESLKLFLGDERTAALPLRWNVFAAQHIRSNGEDKQPTEAWYNGHNNFNNIQYPNTAVCYVKTEYKPGQRGTFADAKGLWSFMGGNSDRLFFDNTIKGPGTFVAEESQKFKGFEARKEFSNPVETNLWYWKNKVSRYV